MLLSIVIPCLNETKTIERAVKTAYKAGQKYCPQDFEVIVADNGSVDGSQLKVLNQRLARLIRVPFKGYGAALHWGIMKSKGHYVLYADADLSYNFLQLKMFVPYLKKYDLVLGSRFAGTIKPGAMPWLHRYLGTPVLTALIYLVYGLRSTDCNSGMRLVKKSFYKTLHMHNSGMEWASELLIKTALNQGFYAEVPITLYKDKRQRASHLLSWIDGWRHLKAIVLLKPNSLLMVVAGMLILAVLTAGVAFALSFFLVLITFGLILSILAAKLIQLTLDHTHSVSVTVLNKLPIVPITVALNVFAIFLAIFTPTHFEQLALIGLAGVIIIDVWVFHIETIRTHLLNRLPSYLR